MPLVLVYDSTNMSARPLRALSVRQLEVFSTIDYGCTCSGPEFNVSSSSGCRQLLPSRVIRKIIRTLADKIRH